MFCLYRPTRTLTPSKESMATFCGLVASYESLFDALSHDFQDSTKKGDPTPDLVLATYDDGGGPPPSHAFMVTRLPGGYTGSKGWRMAAESAFGRHPMINGISEPAPHPLGLAMPSVHFALPRSTDDQPDPDDK